MTAPDAKGGYEYEGKGLLKFETSVVDPELLPGSGSGTRKVQSWIRIRNKSSSGSITLIKKVTGSLEHIRAKYIILI